LRAPLAARILSILTPPPTARDTPPPRSTTLQATREELNQHAAALEDLWHLTNGRRGGRAAAEAAAGETSASTPATEARPTDYRTSGARFFKVRFTDSVELLRNHSGYLVGGWLFIEAEDLKAIVAGRYRSYLSQCLAHAYKALPPLLRDERLAPVLDGVSKAYAGPQYGGEGGKPVDTITADDVDALASSAFPLCMQNLQAGLKAESHLRHGGRMQYGLFLKGVGLSLEDALVFWQREFTKKMTPEQFLKQYAYNIRHNYGKEGKRVDYTAYSCSKILNGPPPGAGA
jgi:DNA primase large subunit